MKSILMLLMLISSVAFATPENDKPVLKEKDGTVVVNTTKICKVRGYVAKTPLKVFFKNGKITKVIALANDETPEYFATIREKMLPKYRDINIDAAEKVDGVTGATYSSSAVKANIKAAIKKYKETK